MSQEKTEVKKSKSVWKKWTWLVIGVLVLSNGFLFFSKKSMHKKHVTILSETKDQYENHMKAVLDDNTQKQLSLMMKTFVWAVRSSMIRKNMDEVDQYFTELIQEEHITEIILVNNEGKILVSTNKKHQHKAFSNFYPKQSLQAESVLFLKPENSQEYHVSTPVLSLNQKIGVLFLVYNAPFKEMATLEQGVNPSDNSSPTLDSVIENKDNMMKTGHQSIQQNE